MCDRGDGKSGGSTKSMDRDRFVPGLSRTPLLSRSKGNLLVLPSLLVNLGLVLMSAKFEIAIRKNLQGLGYAL